MLVLSRSIFFFCIFTIRGVFCLAKSELQVPAAVMRGEPVTLNCTFDLEGDILYSIKWYKNNVEFYRYIPSEKPPEQIYGSKGINLDDFIAQGQIIRLEKTDLNSEGSYKCEVSGEAPSFQTVMDEKELRIYVLPERGPSILGSRAKYRIGDEVNVTCMSGPAKPPSFLQWDLNGKEVMQQSVTRLTPLRHADGLQSSMLALRFMVEPGHFVEGRLRLGCTAFISKAYLTTRSEIIATNKAKIPEQHAFTNRDGPVINGGRTRYQENQAVNVNCTAIKAHPPAELRWYINDKEANSDYLRYYDPIRYPDGHFASVLGLRFSVTGRHFQRGEMQLRCTSTLFRVTDVANEEMLIISRNQQSSAGLPVYIGRDANRGTSQCYHDNWTSSFSLLVAVYVFSVF